MTVELTADLIELYENGRTQKYQIQKHIYKKFILKIEGLKYESTIIPFKTHPNYFKPFGNHYSMRIDDQYRIEMEVAWLDAAQTICEIYVFKLSNHYGD